VIVVALGVGFGIGRASSGSVSDGESITGVVQGMSASRTSVGFTPDGGTETSYNVVPDAEGIQLLTPERRVVLRLGTLPDGSEVSIGLTQHPDSPPLAANRDPTPDSTPARHQT
jgi:hypothetical protein